MRKIKFPLAVFCLLPCVFSHAQQIQLTPDIKKQIDVYIQAEMKAEQIPGLTYAVVSNEKIIDSGAYGLANVELNAPVTSHSLFSIGSIGKTFTATGIMLLQKEGKLSINDPINKYLDSIPESWKNITIKNLLSHTSGIRDHWHDFPGYPFLKIDRKQQITEADFIRTATSVPLNFNPGERWAYSNANFVLLGFIIHKVSGKSLPEFMKERIFDPLQMKETRYINFTEIIPNRATGYLLNDDNKLINGLVFSNFYATQGDMGIITTATDMAKWSIALDQGKILLQQTWTPSQLNNGFEAMGIVGGNYGLGWGILDHRGHKEIGHSGSFGNGYTANFSRFPEKNIAIIVLANLNPSNVDWIGYNIAGFFLPELKGIDQLETEKNVDTSFNKNMRAFLKSLGTGNYDHSVVTESYVIRINPITKIVFDSSANFHVTFIGSDKMPEHYQRIGIPVKKISYYKIIFLNETHYLAVYLTADNKIADLRGY